METNFKSQIVTELSAWILRELAVLDSLKRGHENGNMGQDDIDERITDRRDRVKHLREIREQVEEL